MRIGGLQKVSLLDYPGKIACTVFLCGCSLRCPYCHNPGLVFQCDNGESISEVDLFAFLKARQRKLDGVCVTGGEPMLHRRLPELLHGIRQMGFSVKLDTNGTNPALLAEVLRSGLVDYVAMDIKNAPSRYTETCGGFDVLEAVRESAALLMNGPVDYEFRTTVCAPLHTPEGMKEIGRWLHGAKRYYLQPFVDSGELVGGGVRALSAAEVIALREAVLPDIPGTQIRGQ